MACNGMKTWSCRVNEELSTTSEITVRGALNMLMQEWSGETITLGHGDPAAFLAFEPLE